MLNLTEMNDYGQIEPIKVDYENRFATFHLHGLPSQALFGKVKNVKTVNEYFMQSYLNDRAKLLID